MNITEHNDKISMYVFVFLIAAAGAVSQAVIVKKHEHTVLALHCAKRSALHAMER